MPVGFVKTMPRRTFPCCGIESASAREDGEGKLSDEKVPGFRLTTIWPKSWPVEGQGNSRRVNTRFEVGRESLPLGFTCKKKKRREDSMAEGDCSRADNSKPKTWR